ncbi:MAG: hypothetical protein UH625_08690 [Muribaculaceae bacterium]|nr:hypothetical protein [Muribaculaceae bacterium]
MKINKYISAICALVALSSFSAMAQDALSPYSRFGYGTLRDNATSSQRAMGGVGYAMQSGRQINVMNPAAYAAMDSLTFLFDMGVTLSHMSAKDAGNKASDWGGGLDYITFQFPIMKNMGASVGMVPVTSTGYAFGEEISNGSSAYQGSGGINLIYAGLGYRPFKGFSLGANVGYMFGNTTNDNYVYTSTGSMSLFQRVMEVRDYSLQFGVQYVVPLSRHNRMTFGVSYTPGKGLRGKTYGVMYDQNDATEPDTTQVMHLNGNYSMPDTWGAGVNLALRNRWMVEADFTYQPWKNAKYATLDGFEGTRFDNRWKVAMGVQYTPNPRGSWIQRVNYRMGAYYDRDYIMIGDNHLRKEGVTLGFGLPAPNSKTVINLSMEYYRRKATPNPLVKENYFNITLGVNFNELWFWQSKIR